MSEPIQAIATNNYLLTTPIGSGYMETSALEYDGDKISGYAGSAFKAGDEFPQSATEAIETVTANSADWNGTTDTVSSNSGVWGGSALPISVGPGIKVNLVDNTLVFSNDETVLWETTANQSVVTASESTYNFDRTRFYMFDDNNDYAIINLPSYLSANHGGNFMPFDNEGDTMRFATIKTTDGIVWSANGKQKVNSTAFSDVGNGWIYIKKIVGINRIAGE